MKNAYQLVGMKNHSDKKRALYDYHILETNVQENYDAFFTTREKELLFTKGAEPKVLQTCSKLVGFPEEERSDTVQNAMHSKVAMPNFQPDENHVIYTVKGKGTEPYIPKNEPCKEVDKRNVMGDKDDDNEHRKAFMVLPPTLPVEDKGTFLANRNYEVVHTLPSNVSEFGQLNEYNMFFEDSRNKYLQDWTGAVQPRKAQQCHLPKENNDFLHPSKEVTRNNLLPSKNRTSLCETFLYSDENVRALIKKIVAQEETIGKLNIALLNVTETLSKEQEERESDRNKILALNQKVLFMQREQSQISLEYKKELNIQKTICDHLLDNTKKSLIEAQNRNTFLVSENHNVRLSNLSSSQKSLIQEEVGSRLIIENVYLHHANLFLVAATHELRGLLTGVNRLPAQSSLVFVEVQERAANPNIDTEKLGRSCVDDFSAGEQHGIISSLEKRLTSVLLDQEGVKMVKMELEEDNMFLRSRVSSLTKELNAVDDVVVSQINDYLNTISKAQQENRKLYAELQEITKKYKTVSTELLVSKSRFSFLHRRYSTAVNSLQIAKGELLLSEREKSIAGKKADEAAQQLVEKESKASYLTAANMAAEHCIEKLRDELENVSITFNSVLESRNSEIKTLQEHLSEQNKIIRNHEIMYSSHIGIIKDNQLAISSLKKSLSETEKKCLKISDDFCKVHEECDMLKQSHKELLLKFAHIQEESSQKQELLTTMADNLRKIASFSFFQETKLESLREENVILKKSLNMFLITAKLRTQNALQSR